MTNVGGLDHSLLELQHVCRSVLRLPEGGDLETVLRLTGFLSIQDVLATPDQKLQDLSAGTTRNTHVQILPGTMALLVMLRRYQIYRADKDQHIRDWTQVTHAEFNDFRRGFILRDQDQLREQDIFKLVSSFLRSFNIQAATQEMDKVPEAKVVKKETSDKKKTRGKHVRIVSTAKWTCNTHDAYTVSEHSRRPHKGALCDRGANGIVFGDDVRMIFKTDRRVDIMGIDQHMMNDIYIGTAGGVTQTNKGPLILVMNQGAYHGKGHSILAPAQLEAFDNIVEDRSIEIGGNQCIFTP